jgi:glutamyl-tRNA reductase
MKSMAKIKKNDILIIGAGRLGTTLASVLATKPVPYLRVRYIASRTEKSLTKAKKIIGKYGREIMFTKDMVEGVKDCSIIFICTPDDEIETPS